ncbi:MAG: outer membrane protein assembly factor BamA [Desulfobulbaceae bacterium]|nr:outer membrane protein assembly factor BamA [Desulfobulbaceae bacterium]
MVLLRNISKLFVRATLMSLCLIIVQFIPSMGYGQQQTTLFIPLKINSPSPHSLEGFVDNLSITNDKTKSFVVLTREEANKVIDYSGVWPPQKTVLAEVAEKRDVAYVVLGTITQLGEHYSVDILVYDRLSENAAHPAYREADQRGDLGITLRETLNDVYLYTRRNDIISTVEIRGNKRIDTGAILRKTRSKSNDTVDSAQLRADMKEIFSMGYFENVFIEAENSKKGKRIIFRVEEKPQVTELTYKGIDDLDEKEVQDAAGLKVNTILNNASLMDGLKRIKEFYKDKGFFNTTVDVETLATSSDEVALTIDIVEGEKIFIKKVLFRGNKTFSGNELEDVIETATRGWLSWFKDSGVLKTEQLKQDRDRLAMYYYNQGFMAVKIGEPLVEQSKEAIAITFPIEEGPRYRVGTVDITGDLIDDKDKLLALLGIRKEEYLNRETLRKDQLKLTDLYAEQGYAFANAHPKITKSEGGSRVDINLQIVKNDLVRFNRVEIKGNVRTRDNVIRRELTVKEGGIFSSKALRKSNMNLQRLGYFEEANITPHPVGDESLMDVIVEVKERSTGQFSIGAGYSSADYLMFMAEISENNLMGTGNQLSLSADISGTATRFNLAYTNPRFFDSELTGGVDIFNMQRDYDDYTKNSTGGGLRFGHPLTDNWKIFYKYSYTDTTLSDISEDASYYILQSQDIRTTSALGLSLVRDTRNRYYSPSAGSRNNLTIKYAGGPLGAEAAFTKIEAGSSWYYSLPLSSVFHLNGSMGRAFENKDNMLPVYEKFYLGGLNSIRGFKSSRVSPRDSITNERIGGDKMWYVNFEVIFPLLTDAGLQGVVFTDFGNVYAVDDDWDFGDYKKAAGLGVRWFSPLGPLRLELGYNLDPLEGEEDSVWDFSIGGHF